MSLSHFTSAALLFCGMASAAKYQEYILAPSSRTLYPAKVHGFNGSISGAETLTGSTAGNAVFDGVSAVTYDFGKNIAGLVTLQIGDVDADQFIGLTYTESSLWISNISSDATEDAGMDEPYWFQPTEGGNFTTDSDHTRGGFRYLTLVHNTTGSIAVQQISVHFSPMPHYEESQIANYTGYFHCNDELLNRIWYAGAYTNQMCTIDPKTGNSLVHPELRSNMTNDEVGLVSWYNNFTIANGSAVLTDGAKRDRLIWPGDMAIAVPAIVASYYDIESIEDSLNSLFSLQNMTTGQLPYAGIPFTERGLQSDTYHMYSLIGIANHFTYTGSLEYVEGKWDQWVLGLNYSLSTIDDSGMANISYSNDWLRFGMGGHNIEANSILYYTIQQGILLGQAVGAEQSMLDSWSRSAEGIKTAANQLLWNETAGFYHDNETTTLAPQDGNVWAVYANLTDSQEKAELISSNLASRWTEYGAPSPEADNAVSPFITSFELQAHFLANNASAALELTRRQWGFMLDDPRMTNSTFMEGYQADGAFHYAPYKNDPRISMSHGWATGPTSVLTFYIAGLHLQSDGGRTWEVYPRLGDLEFVDAGFSTRVGAFSALVNASEGVVTAMEFATPTGTVGNVRLPGLSGSLMSSNGSSVALVNGEALDVPGGSYKLMTNGTANGGNATITGSSPPAQYSGNGAATLSASAMAMVAAIFACLV